MPMPSEPPLPTEGDFNPWNDPMDAETAWQNFGGLTLDEAYARFCEQPAYYQEDFMFMGGIAFAYYFPVVEKYLRTVPEVNSDGDDHEAWILAKAIQNQFEGDHARHLQHLKERVIALADFMCENLARFGSDDAERQRIGDAWSELVAQIMAERPPESGP
jgi:hypothetical protein